MLAKEHLTDEELKHILTGNSSLIMDKYPYQVAKISFIAAPPCRRLDRMGTYAWCRQILNSAYSKSHSGAINLNKLVTDRLVRLQYLRIAGSGLDPVRHAKEAKSRGMKFHH